MGHTGNGSFSAVTEDAGQKQPKKTVDMRQYLDYGNVAGSIIYRLANTERDREMLEDVPHMEFFDLSVVFGCLVDSGESGMAYILVHNAHLKLWDVTAEDLYRAARANTPRLLGYEIKGMKETICEIMQEEDGSGDFNYEECMEALEESTPMYVLSNRSRVEGAACILYPRLIREFADTIEHSLYIIPSSRHEMLLLPTDDMKEGPEIKAMIKEINDTQVRPEDILSYSLYYYDREQGEMHMLQ